MWLDFCVLSGIKEDSLNLLYGKYILLQMAVSLKYYHDHAL